MTLEDFAKRLGVALDPDPGPVANVLGVDVYVSAALPDHVVLLTGPKETAIYNTLTGQVTVLPKPTLSDPPTFKVALTVTDIPWYGHSAGSTERKP